MALPQITHGDDTALVMGILGHGADDEFHRQRGALGIAEVQLPRGSVAPQGVPTEGAAGRIERTVTRHIMPQSEVVVDPYQCLP